jgi:hypothetical protein
VLIIALKNLLEKKVATTESLDNKRKGDISVALSSEAPQTGLEPVTL